VIDYNIRSRNSLEETDREAAIEQIDRLSNWFLETEFNNQTVDVISEIQIFQTCSRTFCSTTEREFLYLINHSIHHMAYAALLGKLQGLTIPHHIGLAPSTATYERNIEGKKHEAFAQ
jgi:ABC-type transport system involved in Fe-S cluster assembly fused permease/ATPase subunit